MVNFRPRFASRETGFSARRIVLAAEIAASLSARRESPPPRDPAAVYLARPKGSSARHGRPRGRSRRGQSCARDSPRTRLTAAPPDHISLHSRLRAPDAAAPGPPFPVLPSAWAELRDLLGRVFRLSSVCRLLRHTACRLCPRELPR